MRIFVLAVALIACGSQDGPKKQRDTDPTWQRDVRPLVDVHCNTCHVDGEAAPFTFTEWADVEVMAPGMVGAVEDRSMPPFSMDGDCRDVRSSLWLSDEDITVFSDWAAAGYPEGDEADYSPGVPDPFVTPPQHDAEAWPVAPFEPDVERLDHYLCMQTDLTFDTETFLSRVDVVPDRLDLVHHVIVYAVPPEAHDALDDLIGDDPTVGADCFGSPVALMGQAVGGWAPGSEDPWRETTEARRIAAGSRIVIEMHYNTLNADFRAVVSDHTSARFWTMDRAEVEHLLVPFTLFDYDLNLAAGETDQQESVSFRLPVDAEVVGSSPHMHLLGQSLHTQVNHADGTSSCLSDVDWDFDWQRTYTYTDDARVPLTHDDEVVLTCAYDNSEANQPSVDGVQQPSRDVHWGDGSLDEMCIDFLSLRVPFDQESGEGVCGGYDRCLEDCPAGDPVCPLVCMNKVGGESCYYCGLDAIFGDCTTRRCSTAASNLNICLDTCPDLWADLGGCLIEQCSVEWDYFYTCAEPHFKSGACASDYETCSGMVP